MTNSIVIHTPEELLEYLSDNQNFEKLPFLELGHGFNLHFTIGGNSWKGEIDWRVGRFVHELQRDILNIHNDLTGEKVTLRKKNADLEDLLITVKVEKGSLDVKVKLDKAIKAMIDKLTGRQITGTIIALGVMFTGGYMFVDYNARMAKLDELTHRYQLQENNNQATKDAMAVLANNSNAIINLLSKTEEEDTFTVQQDEKKLTLSASEARENLPRPVAPAPTTRWTKVWGDFSLTAIDLKSYVFKLSTQGAQNIEANAHFDNFDEQQAFFCRYEEFTHNFKMPKMRLALSININTETNKIENALILHTLDDSNEPIGMSSIQGELSVSDKTAQP